MFIRWVMFLHTHRKKVTCVEFSNSDKDRFTVIIVGPKTCLIGWFTTEGTKNRFGWYTTWVCWHEDKIYRLGIAKLIMNPNPNSITQPYYDKICKIIMQWVFTLIFNCTNCFHENEWHMYLHPITNYAAYISTNVYGYILTNKIIPFRCGPLNSA